MVISSRGPVLLLSFQRPAFRPQPPGALVASVECPCVDSHARPAHQADSATANSTVHTRTAPAGQKWGQGSLLPLPSHRPEVMVLARWGSFIWGPERVSLNPHGGSTEVPDLIGCQPGQLSQPLEASPSWSPGPSSQSLRQYEEAFSGFSVLSEPLLPSSLPLG